MKNEGDKPTCLAAQKRVLKKFDAQIGLTIQDANAILVKHGLVAKGITPLPKNWVEVSAIIPDDWTVPAEHVPVFLTRASAPSSETEARDMSDAQSSVREFAFG